MVSRRICALIVSGITVLFFLQPWRPRGPFYDKYQQVQFGMTEKEVFAILGPPMDEEYPGGSMGCACYYWFDGEQGIVVDFFEGEVFGKAFRRARSSDWVR